MSSNIAGKGAQRQRVCTESVRGPIASAFGILKRRTAAGGMMGMHNMPLLHAWKVYILEVHSIDVPVILQIEMPPCSCNRPVVITC